MSGPPNVVVVVLDCVRQANLPDDPHALDDLPFLQQLRRESIGFPRSASVSHWTAPSHASLFTGLYPWGHGLFHGSRDRLTGEIPLMARWLQRAGYRTGAFSANGLLNPGIGWLEGFEYAAWGCSAYLRSSRAHRPPHELSDRPSGRSPGRRSLDRLRTLSYWGVVGLERFPWLLDQLARFEARWRGDGRYPRPVLAPWIDEAFPRWLRGTPADQPAFAFLNLMDAHEPYLLDREDGISPGELASIARVRQDHHGWIQGRWDPTPLDSERLERLYRASIRVLDARVERLVAQLRAAGRWEDTVFVLTSDHGQAFGRDGLLYHMGGISEDLVRVPLWVRLPHGERGGASGRGWASLIDVAPTVVEATGASGPRFAEGRDLQGLVAQERDEPVYALSDGATFGEFTDPAATVRRPLVDERAIAGYAGHWKAVLSLPDHRLSFLDLDRPDRTPRPADGPAGGEREALTLGVERVAQMLPATSSPREASVDRRLRAWGYAD